MHPFAFTSKRKYPRYRIKDQTLIEGGIGRMNASTKLITIGEGGAGFLAYNEPTLMTPPLPVIIKIKYPALLDLEILSLPGDLLYCFENAENGATFYGVEFIRADCTPHIQRVIQALREEMEVSGRVSLDEESK